MNPMIEAVTVAVVELEAVAVDEAIEVHVELVVGEDVVLAVPLELEVALLVPLELELAVNDELAVCVPPAEPDGARDPVGVSLDDDVALDEEEDVDVADAVAVDMDDLEVVIDCVELRVLDTDDDSEDVPLPKGEDVAELEGVDDAGGVGDGMGTHAGVIPPFQLQVPATLVSVKGPPEKPAEQDQE